MQSPEQHLLTCKLMQSVYVYVYTWVKLPYSTRVYVYCLCIHIYICVYEEVNLVQLKHFSSLLLILIMTDVLLTVNYFNFELIYSCCWWYFKLFKFNTCITRGYRCNVFETQRSPPDGSAYYLWSYNSELPTNGITKDRKYSTHLVTGKCPKQ